MNLQTLNGADFAFLGDAVYELWIREYVLKKGITNLKKLHEESVKFVSRTAQHQIATSIFEELFDEEKDIFLRGRNYHYKIKTADYITASGLEAVIGYLYLKQEQNRLQYLLNKAIKIIEEKHE